MCLNPMEIPVLKMSDPRSVYAFLYHVVGIRACHIPLKFDEIMTGAMKLHGRYETLSERVEDTQFEIDGLVFDAAETDQMIDAFFESAWDVLVYSKNHQ